MGTDPTLVVWMDHRRSHWSLSVMLVYLWRACENNSGGQPRVFVATSVRDSINMQV